MSTAQLDRPAPVLARVTQLRHTSPGRLQLILAALLAAGLLTGIVGGLTAAAARSGTADLGGRSQPLLVEAETVYSSLADADTTAAQAFLTGGLEPVTLTDRYDLDLARATEALTSAARRTPATGAAADAVRALSSGIPRYAALVASARAENRQQLTVGASYLGAASTLNRDELLPQADKLFRAALADVDDGYGNARSAIWVSLFGLLLIVLLVALIWAQRYLSRTTHRTFNLPLLAATAVTVILALGAGGVLIAQEIRLQQAGEQGSRPVAELAYAKILALRERGDEALTLVGRGGDGPSEADFGRTRPVLDQQLGVLAKDMDDAGGLAQKHGDYLAVRAQVRKLDNGGDYTGAVKLTTAPETVTTFEALKGSIESTLEAHRTTFTAQIDKAGTGLATLIVLGPLLALVVCALAVIGLRARLEEYR